MDFKDIKELIRVFDKSELNKLKVKNEGFEIALQKGLEETSSALPTVVSAPVLEQPSIVTAPVASTEVPAAPAQNNASVSGDTVNSPMVGTFYRSASPEAPAFVKVGDTVKKGQTLCILEAMKIMNEVEAEYDFKLLEILVDDATPVEYDMPLFVVEKI